MDPVTDKDQIRSYFSHPDKRPPASAQLGFELQDFDPAKGWARVKFEAREHFCNPRGAIQGGIVTAFLDEAMSVSLFIHAGLIYTTPTLEIKTSFLAPLFPGPCEGLGQVIRKGRSVGFIEGKLFDSDGKLCAVASATSALRPLKR